MQVLSSKSLSLAKIERVAGTCLRQFDASKIAFLNQQGKWAENPQSFPDRISHELLFLWWKSGEPNVRAFLQGIYSIISQPENWALAKKISLRLISKESFPCALQTETEIDAALLEYIKSSDEDQESFSFLVIFEILVGLIQNEALRLAGQAYVPEWNTEAKKQREEFQKGYGERELFLTSALTAEEKTRWASLEANLKRQEPRFCVHISQLIAEEEILARSISGLLQKAEDKRSQDEIYALIVEKIQPPLGIVTNVTPAALFPCIKLLLNEEIDLASGIPHAASVILSILQDPRSSGPLLRALGLYPISCSKIRENIIYTLGNLREESAVPYLARVLGAPDEIRPSSPDKPSQSMLLLEQKEEAIWALGKIGFASGQALPQLVACTDHPSARLKTYLAWALGEIGKAQKERAGGISADLIIALLRLLKDKTKQLFEESVSALKKMGMSEFIHSLDLYHAGAISILGLKPAQRGLYELSETLHYLFQTKKRVIIAVNGDSGTGKTYFCQAIAGGFADIKPDEILYMMRDTKQGQKVFNRILGINWLRKHIDPAYYHDYPLAEEDDNPEEFFQQFLLENADKRLIILDGCRDQLYFQRVIDFFYFRGELDVEVNFRATFSTRRLNLEAREMAVESVKTHLAFLEEPALEDTSFYQEGIVILYDLDNSLSSRLDSQETRELFDRRKIDAWGDLIRIGDFSKPAKSLACEPKPLSLQVRNFSIQTEPFRWPFPMPFSPKERNFEVFLNEDLEAHPNLLQIIDAESLKPRQIRLYAHDQIAGIGASGNVFVLTTLDNRIFETFLENITGLALLGRNIYLTTSRGTLVFISFETNETMATERTESPALKIASLPPYRLATGHEDGQIRIWDFLNNEMILFPAHSQLILALAMDHQGRIYSSSQDGTIKRWDIERKTVKVWEGVETLASLIRLYPHGKILTAGNSAQIGSTEFKIIDFDRAAAHFIQADFGRRVACANVYFDGRIIAGFGGENTGEEGDGNLVIISPGKDVCPYQVLGGHTLGITDCLTMGPKIITCGKDHSGRDAFRVWGTEFFVRTELGKLLIKG